MTTNVPAVPQVGQLPAHLANNPAYQAMLARSQQAASGIRVGAEFPTLSVKGSKFHLRKDGQNTTLVDPTNNLPLQRLEVVVLDAAEGLSKVFYKGAYVEGQTKEPDCYSDDGLRPCGGAEPQSHSCATCPQNQWGTGRDQAGNPTKGKACADTKKLVILPATALDFAATLLQVTPTALKDWGAYVNQLTSQGIPVQAVITYLQFDPASSHPKLQFLFGGLLDEAGFTKVMERAAGQDVQDIIKPREPAANLLPAQQTVQQAQVQQAQVHQPQVQQTQVQQAQVHQTQVQQTAAPAVATGGFGAAPVQEQQPAPQAAAGFGGGFGGAPAQEQQPAPQATAGFGGGHPGTQTAPAGLGPQGHQQPVQVVTDQAGQHSPQQAASPAATQTAQAPGFGAATQPVQPQIDQPAPVVTAANLDAGLNSMLDSILSGAKQG